jgi:hypothetical protein
MRRAFAPKAEAVAEGEFISREFGATRVALRFRHGGRRTNLATITMSMLEIFIPSVIRSHTAIRKSAR